MNQKIQLICLWDICQRLDSVNKDSQGLCKQDSHWQGHRPPTTVFLWQGVSSKCSLGRKPHRLESRTFVLSFSLISCLLQSVPPTHACFSNAPQSQKQATLCSALSITFVSSKEQCLHMQSMSKSEHQDSEPPPQLQEGENEAEGERPCPSEILQNLRRLWVGLIWPEETTGAIELFVSSWPPPPSPLQSWNGPDSHHSGNVEISYNAVTELPARSKRTGIWPRKFVYGRIIGPFRFSISFHINLEGFIFRNLFMPVISLNLS